MTEYNQSDLLVLRNWCDSENGLFSRRPGQHVSMLYTDYDNSIGFFIESIKRATSEEKDQYSEEIFECLYDMARHDDREAIRETFEYCPQVEEWWGYGDELTPLGEAISNSAQNAICAFIDVGYDIEACASGTGDYALDLVEEGCSDDFVLFMVEHGAEITFPFVYYTIISDKNIQLARKMLSTSKRRVWALDKESIDYLCDNKLDKSISDKEHEFAMKIIREEIEKQFEN